MSAGIWMKMSCGTKGEGFERESNLQDQRCDGFQSTPHFDKACKVASRIYFGDQDFIGANSIIVSIRLHSLTLIGSNWN